MLINFKNNEPQTIKSLLETTNLSFEHINRELDILISKKIIKRDNDKYLLAKGYLVGEIQVNDNFAFLLQDDNDIFIPGYSINGALNHDIVLVKKRKDEAAVIEILKRATESLVCVVKKRGKDFYLVPTTNINVPVELREGSFVGGEVIHVKITEYHENFLVGEVDSFLGFETDPGMEVLKIVYEKGFPYKFDERTLKEADNLSRIISKENRFVDDNYLVTIDGIDAKDLDDAVGLTYKDNKYHLSIHIADVSYYVKEGSLIDKEAYERGTSAYLADRVIPMLPRRLSNDLCSLNASEDKYAVSLYVTLDESGNILSHDIKETVINVNKRLSYDEVNEFLNGGKSLLTKEEKEMLLKMTDLSTLLEEKRHKRGELEFKSIEYTYEVDEDHNITKIYVKEQGKGEKIIESFMILANEIVSEHLTRLDLPTIYRVHERPTLEKLKNLSDELSKLELNVKKPRHFNPKSLQSFLDAIKGDDMESYIHDLVLRSMTKARYDMQNLGHFGLASTFYSHFTAPIRRYPDLFLHRMIKEFLIHPNNLNEKITHFESIGKEVCFHTSKQERVAEELSREVDKLKISEYMSTKIGNIYKGVVSGIIKKGFFVRTLDEGIEGMVVFNDMKGHVHFDEYRMTIKLNKRTLKIGSPVKVELIDVDVKKRQITFELLKER